jgi:hypothetical protein
MGEGAAEVRLTLRDADATHSGGADGRAPLDVARRLWRRRQCQPALAAQDGQRQAAVADDLDRRPHQDQRRAEQQLADGDGLAEHG